MRSLRVVVVTNYPVHYRSPVFNSLARLPGYDFQAIYCAISEQSRQWDTPTDMEYPWKVVSSPRLNVMGRPLYASPRIFRAIADVRPDVLLTGGFSLPTTYCIAYRQLSGRRTGLVFFGEATRHSEQGRGWLRTALRKRQVSFADAFVAASEDSVDYFCDLGAARTAIWKSLLTTDVNAFEDRSASSRAEVESLRAQLGLRGKIILYCGRLMKHKGVHLLLDSFHLVQSRQPHVSLLLVGSGAQERELREIVKCQAMRNVHFIGFQQPGDLPIWYQLADLFVFPTLYEPFGLVVVEAIAAGLPIVCSKYAGAARDLVLDGENGFVVDPVDAKMLADRMLAILGDDATANRMRTGASRMLELCRVERAAEQFRCAIEHAAGARHVSGTAGK